MSLPDISEITSSYLYGQTTVPDLEDDSFMQNGSDDRVVSVNIQEYMTSGAGRFATAEQFYMVQKFFSTDPGDGMQPGESLSKAEYIARLGLQDSDNGLYVYQNEVADGKDDYGERSFIWNSGSFKISDDAIFKVNLDGTRVIEFMSVVPRQPTDNFDFTSSNPAANIGNDLLKSWIDPWEIGSTVSLQFSDPGPGATYTLEDYLDEIALRNTWTTPSNQELYDSMVEVANKLWADGVTKFVADDGGIIKYGSTSDDILTSTFSKSTDWTSSLLEWWLGSSDNVGAAKLQDYLANGFRIYGGAGNDILVGGDLPDGFTVVDLQDADYFSTYHSEWNDGVRDNFSGGDGSDILLTSSSLEGPGTAAQEVLPPDLIDEIASTLDFVDGSDSDFTLYSQAYQYEILTNVTLTSDILAAAKVASSTLGYYDFGEIAENIYEGGTFQATIVGERVDHPEYGTLLLLGQQSVYLSFYYAAITNFLGARDPSKAENWTIYGHGNTGGGSANLADLADNDTIVAGNGTDAVYALSGDDHIDAGTYGGGDDYVNGGEGDDTVDYSASEGGITVLFDPYDEELNENFGYVSGADVGSDYLVNVENIVGSTGNDDISGSDANNSLMGGDGSDLLAGELGNDTLVGGAGSDTYVYAGGDGADTIEDWGDQNSTDILKLGSGIATSSVTVERGDTNFWDLKLGFGGGASVTVTAGFIASGTVIEQVQFAGGTTWTSADIRAIYLDRHATSGNDVIHGFVETADMIVGRAGNDEIYGYSGNDVIRGNEGNDTLFGQEGADTLIGGAGNDFLVGGAGTDVFVFASSTEGADWIDDFTVGDDRIDLSGIAGFDDFGDVLAIAEEWGGTTWLNFDQSNSIRLQNIALNSLTASDFILA